MLQSSTCFEQYYAHPQEVKLSTQSLKKLSTRDSPADKGGRCVRLTTYHPCSAERQEIQDLNLPGPPWAISTACCGRNLYLYLY